MDRSGSAPANTSRHMLRTTLNGLPLRGIRAIMQISHAEV
jgi:hypothetical protein